MKRTLGWFVCALALNGCATEGKGDGLSIVADVDDAVAAGEASADSARAPTLEGAIATGETKTASFGANAKYLAWTFDADADQRFVLTAGGSGPEIDTVLLVYRATTAGRPTGTAVANNDDDGMNVGSRIDTSAPRAGKYVAIVRRYDLGTTGAIRLSLMLSATDMQPPTPSSSGIAILGGGTHALGGLVTTTIATAADGISGPRDLAFNPNADHELWITSFANNSMLVIARAGMSTQSKRLAHGQGGEHFMAQPSGLAFGQETMSTCHEIDVPTQSSTPADFMGPTLWEAHASLFNGAWATHIDMLHNSPNATGIAWDHANVFWVFDGYHQAVTRYDFQRDHGPGGSDHSDGIVARFVQGEVGYVRGVSSAMELDHRTHLLYIADTGNHRVAVLDTTSGTRGTDITPNYDGGEQYMMRGGQITSLVSTGLRQPSGLALRGGVLYVTDRATSIIHAYRTDGTELDWLDVSSVIAPGSLGAIELDTESRIYVTNVNRSQVIRIATH